MDWTSCDDEEDEVGVTEMERDQQMGQSAVYVETTCAKCATVGLPSGPLRAAAQSMLRTSSSVRQRAAARTVAPIWGALGASMLGLLSQAVVTL